MDQRRTRRRPWARWRRRLALPVAIVLAAGAGSGVLALGARGDAGRLPRGATVDGIDVGQLTPHDAVRLLQRLLGRYPEPVLVRANGRSYTIRPRRGAPGSTIARPSGARWRAAEIWAR